MAALRFLLAMSLALALPLMSWIPGEDFPETTHDESENVPYEKSSVFPSELLRQHIDTRATAGCDSDITNVIMQLRDKLAELRRRPNRTRSVSITLFDLTLRC